MIKPNTSVKDIEALHQSWMERAVADPDLKKELSEMSDAKKEDNFYRELAFESSDLCGAIGAGTNCMNVYTVAKDSQGLANSVKHTFPKGKWPIAVSYDSCVKFDVFAQVAAGAFAANEIHVP